MSLQQNDATTSYFKDFHNNLNAVFARRRVGKNLSMERPT